MKLKNKQGYIDLPCMDVVLVPTEKVIANNYNPNAVPRNNMMLLERSILDNGFCFPIVTIYDEEIDKYVIVDGFHRYMILKDWLQAEQIPIVVLKHDMKKRMAATVQFNRARGVHQVELMGDLVRALVVTRRDGRRNCKALGNGIGRSVPTQANYRNRRIVQESTLFKILDYG